MRFTDPLNDVFQGRSHVKVLRALLALPDGIDASIRELARRAGVTHPTASSVLESFRTQGLALRRRTLLADEYRINREHTLMSPLIAILKIESQIQQELETFMRDEIAARAPWVQEAYLFGSAVTGGMQPDSDIDLALICPTRKKDRLATLMEELSEETKLRFGNPLGVSIGTRPVKDLAQPRQSGYRLWQRVAKDGVRLLPEGTA